MTEVKGTSNVPLIMGIIGGVLGLPSAICAGLCVAFIETAAEQEEAPLGAIILKIF
ncbi:MAG: hypothetical protein LBP64_08820 [Tannerella sp.]|jgi:hypothetical protein|nr:hypothetical protein [Tannerella sp.]